MIAENVNGYNPIFDFEKNGVTLDDIAEEDNRQDSQCDEADSSLKSKFPIHVLPKLFREYVLDCEKSLNFPIDYTAVAIISAVSVTIGKSAQVRVKNGWYEYCSIYCGLIGNAGASKSHPMENAFQPIENIDREEIKRYAEEYQDFDDYQNLSKSEKTTHSKLLAPVLKKTILHNFTPEILFQRLTDNDRGNVVAVDELATFLEGMNNYSKGDQTSGYLSIWSNKGTSIDRVGKPIPLYLPSPFLNIIGTLQPRVIPKLFPSNKSDNGFLQRFLWAYPENSEKNPISDFEINEELLDLYEKWIINCRTSNPIKKDIESGKPNPKIYYWSDEAKVFFYNWQRINTEKVNENSDNLFGEILSKFDNHFVRLCLILQIMIDYNTNQISIGAVKGAAELCTYFQNTSMKVLEILENRIPTEGMSKNKLEFYNQLPDDFTTAEANNIGENFGLNIKAVQRLLANNRLFVKQAQGQYSKK